MRFTPTAKYLALARGLSKVHRWRVYVKKTTDLSEDLTVGTWLDVTHRITSFPDIHSQIEYEIGQFTSDALGFSGDGSSGALSNIAWWKANVFNTTPIHYVEVKVLFELVGCSDIVYAFNGVLAKRKDGSQEVRYTESMDSVEFTAYTLQDYGQGIAAENLAVQYTQENIDGLNTMGIILPNIPGAFVIDANPDDNLLLNAGFETYTGDQDNGVADTFTSWTATTPAGRAEATGVVHKGTNALKFFRTGAGDCYLYQDIAVEASKVYELSFFARGSGAVGGKYAIYDVTHASYILAATATGITGATYTRKSTVFTTPAGCINIRIELHASDTISAFGSYFDSVDVSKLINDGASAVPLLVGTHTLAYEYNGGAPTLTLDDGISVTLQAGVNVLANETETQQVKLFITDLALLPLADTSDELVVIAAGSTLPKQWPVNTGAAFILKAILEQMGISSVTFDTLRMNSATGAAKVSFIGSPPEDPAVNGVKWALADDGTDLFISIGNDVYRFNVADNTFALVTSVGTANDRISRLFYNARNQHLWIVFGTDGTGNIARYEIVGDVLNEVPLTGITAPNAIALIDFNYSGASYKYAIVYADGDESLGANGDIREIDGTSLTDSLIFSATTMGYTLPQAGAQARVMYVKDGNKPTFSAWQAGPVDYKLHRIHVDGAGAWVDDGVLVSGIDTYLAAAYHPGENRVYYAASNRRLASHIENNPALTNLTAANTGLSYDVYYSPADAKVYATLTGQTAGLTPNPVDERFYSAVGNVATLIDHRVGILTRSLWNFGGILYGIDRFGRLWQYHTTVAFYIATGKPFGGGYITDAWNKTLTAFNLIGTISSTKQGKVFRRGNATGTPLTSGNILAITINEVTDIVEENSDYGAAFGLVEVSNGNVTFSYDGTAYNTAVLTDVRKLTITNELIPDEIVQDLCYYAYQFFKTDRTLYTIDLGNTPLFQFEPFDGCSVTFTGKIQRTAVDKPIYGTTLMKNGNMQVQVLI